VSPERLLHEVRREAVSDAEMKAAAHALAYVARKVDPGASPPLEEVRWFVIDLDAVPELRPLLAGGGLRMEVRPNSDLGGYCSQDGEIWVRLDSDARRRSPDDIARTTAHEAMHRYQYVVLGRDSTVDPRGDENEAGSFAIQYHVAYWTQGGAELADRAGWDWRLDPPEGRS
jgi:hypothetical protein